MRSNGILCAISSLPSKYGVGDLGYPSYQFSKELKEAGIKYWQILPLNPTDVVNSPYASECDLGIDYVYVSLELLKKEGYLKNIKKFAYNEERVNYREVRAFKDYYLRKAFKNQNDLENRKRIKGKEWGCGTRDCFGKNKKNGKKDFGTCASVWSFDGRQNLSGRCFRRGRLYGSTSFLVATQKPTPHSCPGGPFGSWVKAQRKCRRTANGDGLLPTPWHPSL